VRRYLSYLSAAMRYRSLLLVFLCSLGLLSACTHLPSGMQRKQQVQSLLATQAWHWQTLQAGDFSLFAAGSGTVPAQADVITIYLEGDGLAWLNMDTPSDDPTPLNPLALRLAMQQPGGTAIYLARPCQYATPLPLQCTPELWTSARFSSTVVNALDEAVSQLKHQYRATHINLVGYSGGAALALLLAERRDDVQLLLSVAGNVDPSGWTRLHNLSPLQGSLDPLASLQQLRAGQVWLFSGEEDENIPPVLANGVAARLKPQLPVALRTLPGFNHHCCWDSIWPTLWRQAAEQVP
jgi:hypothetical protein